MKDYLQLLYTPGNEAKQALSSFKHTPSADSKMLCEFFLQKIKNNY